MDNFAAAYGRLNQQQRQAVDAIDGPVLVIAGPGTGKTQLLTTRIANILSKTDVLPANILCLTFTESAAATMRDRLSRLIGQAAYNVTISTYHAFGSELIRRYPEHFSDAYDLEPVDDLTLDSIFRHVQSRLPYRNPLKHEIFLRDIKALVSDFKRALLTPAEVREVAAANQRFIAAASRISTDLLAGMARIDKSAVPRFEQLLIASHDLPHDPLPGSAMPLAAGWSRELAAALEAHAATGKTNDLTAWKNNWLEKDEANRFVAAGRDQLRKLAAAADIYEHYLTELQRRRLYDYDDMILQAIRGLEHNADLRYSLQERYLYLLLDEFQDTNEAQSRLVQLLTDNPVSEGRPNVLAVGDDDQAIYSFQGADYSHMLNFYERYRDVVVVPLTENYRSLPEILQTAAGISGQIAERLHHHFPAIDKTLTAANQGLPGPATVERHEFLSDLGQNAWVADRIKHLVEQGMPASDIAVLAPKHEYLEGLVPFLHHRQLPVHYEKRENVLDDQSVTELVTMSRLVLALAAGEQTQADHLWSQILSFRFWQLPTSLIWRLSWQARDSGQGWTYHLCEQPETKLLALFFISLSLQAAAEPLETMLDYLIGVTALPLREDGATDYRSPFYEYYFGPLKNGSGDTEAYWQLLSNLTVLRQRLRDYRSGEQVALQLPDFIDFVEASRAAGLKLLNTSPYQEATEAVELLTAYKAKGQEYGAVFILAAIDEVWGTKARNLGSRISLPPNLQFIRYAGTTEDERLRLLYVALTRAKTQLYLTSYRSSYTGRHTTRLKYLDETEDRDGRLTSPLLPPASRTVYAEDTQAPQLPDMAVYWQHRHYRAIRQPELKELLTPRLERFQLSPSVLNCFTDTSSDGPLTVFTQDLLCFPTAPTISGQYGSAIHETLDWLLRRRKATGRLPSRAAALTTFQQRLQRRRLGEPHYSLLLERGREALSAYLAQRADSFHASDYSEYNFRNEGVFVGEAHLAGKIDRLLVDADNRTISIVDFKTGRPAKRWTNDIKLHSYKQQLYMYKLLVEGSHGFRGYTVTDAYLEFVEPDDDGQIRQLHLQFTAEAEQQLRQLIGRVWQHVMTLNFPDVSGYSPDIKGIESFQRDLIDGKA